MGHNLDSPPAQTLRGQRAPARFALLAGRCVIERVRCSEKDRHALFAGRALPDADQPQAARETAQEEAKSDALPVVVLDTNVVLDIFYWKDAQSLALSEALQMGRMRVVTNAACLEEFADVLSRPAFGLSSEEQIAFLERYAHFCTAVDVDLAAPVTCRDADDQKFLDLAYSVAADMLVTKDKLLKKAAKRLARFGVRVCAPPQAASLLCGN